MRIPRIRNARPAKAAAVLAVVAGAIFASVLPSSADVSAQSPSQTGIRVQSPAERLARGAALRVELTIVCPAGWSNYANVRVTQRVGPGIASGSGYTPITCTGGLQTLTVSVHAEEHPFRVGTAYASAYTSTGSGQVSDEREIAIVRS
ncbi:hypothetical protein FHX81_5288 [Saccharothrix saharensis]|uniref:Ig-like domain-containing protein n=1 Tax=Saccharothrix saharensis TaxID=571190 RepID=A0A543JJ40_9PSEU|nr:hypothetical protein [Saccharothrix saharensis]TQM82877.1 hypothetical protein FHX81_5288 [Saccharothrix saharensis]